jgi:hypothetical protein
MIDWVFDHYQENNEMDMITIIIPAPQATYQTRNKTIEMMFSDEPEALFAIKRFHNAMKSHKDPQPAPYHFLGAEAEVA